MIPNAEVIAMPRTKRAWPFILDIFFLSDFFRMER